MGTRSWIVIFIWLEFVVGPALAVPTVPASATTKAENTFPPPSASIVRRTTALIEQVRRTADGGDDREQALDGLIDIGPEAIPLLLGELERRSRDTWPEMIYVLGATGDPRVIPYLRRELNRQAGKAYMDTIYALTLAGDRDALLVALRSANAGIAFEAGPGGTALDFIAGAIGPRAADVLRRELPHRARDARMLALGALATIASDESVDFLLGWAKQPDPVDRRHALLALARIGDLRARPAVMAGLSDAAPEVREAAIEAAGYLREAQAIASIAPLVRERGASVTKAYAIWSLGLIGGPEAVAALTEALGVALDVERARVIQALGLTRDKNAVPVLVREATSSHPLWSRTAVESLLHLPIEMARDALLTICGEADDHSSALLAAQHLLEQRDPRAVPCAFRRLKDEFEQHQGVGPEVQSILDHLPLCAPGSAASTLDALADEVSAPSVQHRMRMTAQAVRLAQERGNDPASWLELLKSGRPNDVDLAVQRLGDLGDSRAVEPLTRLFGRTEPERAWLIPEALGKIGSERATVFLTQLLTDDVYRVPSLERARVEAVRALARYSRSPVAAQAMRDAFVADRGRMFVALMGYARVRGASATRDLVELNALQLARRNTGQLQRHERVNWAIRLLRAGHEIPLDAIRDR